MEKLAFHKPSYYQILKDQTTKALEERTKFQMDPKASNFMEMFNEYLSSEIKNLRSYVGSSGRPKRPQPSTSKLNEGVLERKSSPFERMINEKLTEPMRVLSVKSDDEDFPGNISKDIDLPPPSEPLHFRGMFTFNLEW